MATTEKVKAVLCYQCNSGWEILPGESFCGWCGSPIKGFRVTPLFKENDVLRYIDEDDEFVLKFQVENYGIHKLSIDNIKIEE